jgi:guanine deaminase
MAGHQAIFGTLLLGDRLQDGWLGIEEGKVAYVQPAGFTPAPDAQQVNHSGKLITPGLIDAHVHANQTGVIASYGTALLDWLNTYTFPYEAQFANEELAHRHASFFLDELLAHGTTTACVFPTVHKVTADALFAEAYRRNMRLITGKVMMDRHCPDNLQDTVASAERDCRDLIERWHGKGRLHYAVTPRFAATSTPAQLQLCGELLAAHRQRGAAEGGPLFMQTHVAENHEEIAWIAQLFPKARSYLDVYASHGLLSPRSIFAHGIYLDNADRQALASSGASIAFCPSSNLFLGSGLFGHAQAHAAGVGVALASDVGGGTSLSMLATMHDAYKVCAMQGERLTAWQAFGLATHGAAQCLQLNHAIGRLAPGMDADFVVWDWATEPMQAQRQERATTDHEKLFALMMQGGRSNVRETWVAGTRAYAQPGR